MSIRDFKILQISSSISEELGGPSQVVEAVSEYLKRSNIENKTMIWGTSSRKLQDVLTIDTLFNNRFGFPVSLKNKHHLFLDHDILLIHGFYLFSTLYSIFASKTNNIFLMPHGSLEFYQEKRSKFKKKIFGYLLRRVLRNRKIHFLVGSNSETGPIQSKFPDCKVSVVGLGINLNSLKISDDGESNTVKRNLLCLSRITDKKRIDLSILALHELRQRGFEYNLDIAGDGDPKLRRKLELVAENLNVSEYISWHNFVSGPAKKNLFRTARIFLLPSENENFAIAVAEAIANEVPVVVSKYVAMHEFVDTHETGVTIEELDPMSIVKAILEIEESYMNFVSNCRDNAHLLQWDDVFNKWISVIEENIAI